MESKSGCPGFWRLWRWFRLKLRQWVATIQFLEYQMGLMGVYIGCSREYDICPPSKKATAHFVRYQQCKMNDFKEYMFESSHIDSSSKLVLEVKWMVSLNIGWQNVAHVSDQMLSMYTRRNWLQCLYILVILITQMLQTGTASTMLTENWSTNKFRTVCSFEKGVFGRYHLSINNSINQ